MIGLIIYSFSLEGASKGLAFGALILSIFVGWVWGAEKAVQEIEQGSPAFAKTRGIWIFMIRFFIPIVIFVILLNLFGLFG